MDKKTFVKSVEEAGISLEEGTLVKEGRVYGYISGKKARFYDEDSSSDEYLLKDMAGLELDSNKLKVTFQGSVTSSHHLHAMATSNKIKVTFQESEEEATSILYRGRPDYRGHHA